MTEVIAKLKEWGCDVDAAMHRCLDDEDFYLKCLKRIRDDQAFEELGRALESGDVARSFDIAHSMKGSISNVGLTPLYDLIVQIVEPLRAGNINGLARAYLKLMSEKIKFDAIMKDA